MASQKFPTTIYVTRESERDGTEYFVVHTDATSANFQETTPVAVYDLVGTGAVEVTREFRQSLRNAQKTAIRRAKR